MKTFNKYKFIMCVIGSLLFSSCADDEVVLPTLGVAFETTGIGITATDPTADVVITFSRPTTLESSIEIGVAQTLVQAGVDFTTTPAITGGVITLDVPTGSSSASFSVTRTADLISSLSSVVFTLNSIESEEDTQISGNTTLELSFEAIASPGNSLVANIGGPTEPNQVFVDFSLNSQVTAERVSWDLGLFAGNEDKVIVNYSTYGMAQALSKTDMNSVSSADTVGFATEMRIGTAGADIYVDNPDKDLEKLVFADVSSTDANNPVYIINRGGGPGTGTVNPGSVDVGSTPRGWKKVRILMDGDDYVIQHADISTTSFTETRITKDDSYNFNYFSFDDGAVVVEPVKSNWDIVFSVSTNIINFGAGDGAYGFSDFVLSNRQGGTQVARIELNRDSDTGEILPGQTEYDDFAAADLNTLTFAVEGNTIGSSWRSVFSRTAHNYVYFVIKDAEGNNYKLQMLGILDQDGNRGNTSFKYELL
ncbi:MAG: HmuY family protein [Bacteroidota bacterium]